MIKYVLCAIVGSFLSVFMWNLMLHVSIPCCMMSLADEKISPRSTDIDYSWWIDAFSADK